jgi:hypothetical protein
MTGERPQIDKPRVLFWVLAFFGFAVFGYVYHWWSGDARNASIFATPNFDVFIVPRVTQTLLEMMLISLLVLLVSGWLKSFGQARVNLQAALKTYGIFLLVVLNPPVLATAAWFYSIPDIDHVWFVPVFILLIEIILELIVILRFGRPIFKFLGSLFNSWRVLPAAFWGIWLGFVLWSFQPAITLSCSANPNLQLPTSQLESQIFYHWVNRLEPIPKTASLPPVDYITELKAIPPNMLQNACQDKAAFSFLPAHHVFWLDLGFYAKDGLAYRAKAKVTVSENLELQLVGAWQVQKDTTAKANNLATNKRKTSGELGIIGQQLEPLFQVVPDLRQSPCVGFTRPKSATDDSRIVADFDTSSTLENLYIIRSGKLERAWNQAQIRASLQRISQRLGYETVKNWNEQRVFDGGIASCSANKAYFGLQSLEDRYVSYIPLIEVTTGTKKFNVVLSFLTGKKPSLSVFKLSKTEPSFEERIYEFLPTEQDIPWNNVSTNDLEYSGSRLISQKTIK